WRRVRAILSSLSRERQRTNSSHQHRSISETIDYREQRVSGLDELARVYANEPCPKSGMSEKRQASTGSAGALARYEREARNSCSVNRFEIERAAHARRARAPALPVLTGSFQIGS